MQPIQINVQINIGVNDGLYSLLSSLLSLPQITPAEVIAEETKPTVAESKPQPAVSNQPAPAPATAETPVSKTAVPSKEPQPEAPAETAQETKEYTEVDVRAAMDRTRKRIEGENWKENPDSEGYKKWHRPLTAWFKNTAAICGAEKPSALPDGESCQKFVAYCDAVYVKDDELVEDCPF